MEPFTVSTLELDGFTDSGGRVIATCSPHGVCPEDELTPSLSYTAAAVAAPWTALAAVRMTSSTRSG